MSLRIVPIDLIQAKAFITKWHRHHRPPVGYRFALGVASICDGTASLVGVATVGRPVNRHLQDGWTVEVTRVATDGTPHACSALYGACWRAAKAMGYVRAVTYTQDGESGASLRAAGWAHAATRAARHGWDMPGRRRDEADYQAVDRFLWLVESGIAAPTDLVASLPEVDQIPALFDAAEAAA